MKTAPPTTPTHQQPEQQRSDRQQSESGQTMNQPSAMRQHQTPARPYSQYALITAGYLGLYGGFVALASRRGARLSQPIGALDLTLLGLATLRLSRLAAWESITSFLRLPLVEHGPHDPVTGPQQKPRGRGLLRALGELVLCTTCVGTWIAALLTYSLYLAPNLTRPFLAIMAAAGLSQASDAALALIYAARDSLDARRS